MALNTRIRSKWKKSGRETTLGENSVALAYIVWQIALTTAKNLHKEDFEYESDDQRIDIIAEIMIFLVHIADRLTYPLFNHQERIEFIETLGKETARHLQRNKEEIITRGDHTSHYINRLNQRIAEYGGCSFEEQQPGHQMTRALGEKIQDIMGDSQTNRWVMEQVMGIDIPKAVQNLKQGLNNLLKSSNKTKP